MNKTETREQAFLFRYSWAEELQNMPEQLRNKINDAIQRFALYGEEPKDATVKYSMFSVIRNQILRDREEYQKRCIKNRENITKRWEQIRSNTTEYDRIRPNTIDTNIKKSKVIKEKESIEKESTKRSAFVPPTLEDVRAYFRENGYSEAKAVEAFNYYDVANWHDATGKPIKNWKQKMIGVWFKEENRVLTLKPQSNEQAKQRHCFN